MSDSPKPPPPPSIPVICDRCRATGASGAGDFAHLGDLLDFTPVPRKTARADGWTPERQRAFIAALSATGSKRRAALAIGMSPFGVDQMLKHKQAGSFRAAFDRAKAIAEAHGSMKIAAGVADAAARNAQMQPSRLRGLPPPAPEEEPEVSEEQKLELLERIANKFLRKVAQERTARVSGEIVAADFYLRQITMIEVCFDLLTSELGFNAGDYLRSLRRGDHELIDIVDTQWVQFLDRKRREYWLSDPSEPPRPILFKEEFLEDHGDHRTQPSHAALGGCSTPARGYDEEQWKAMTIEEQRSAREKQYEEDAAEQVEYERQAQEAWESQAVAEHKAQSRSDT